MILKLFDAGNVLFMDWSFTAYCNPDHDVKVLLEFGIAGMTISGHKDLLKELNDVYRGMQDCLEKWHEYLQRHRNKYYYLNYFSAKQLVNLCSIMPKVQQKNEVGCSVLNMLSFIKENITEEDLSDSFTKAIQTPAEVGGANMSLELKNYLVHFPKLIDELKAAGFSEDEAKASVMYCSQNTTDREATLDEDTVMSCIYNHVNDGEWVKTYSEQYEEDRELVLQNQLKFKVSPSQKQIPAPFEMSEEEASIMFKSSSSCQEKIVMLWEAYSKRLAGFVSEKYVGLDLVGETLKSLAEMEQVPVKRRLPFYLDESKPNLVTCKDEDMLPLCLSIYNDEKQPLPTYDEVLICTSETPAEEVELIIRRAIQSGCKHDKIYCILNADKLDHDVSRKLESYFYQVSQKRSDTQSKEYRLIIFCSSAAQHSYVLTAFYEYRKTEQSYSMEDIQKYLKEKLKLSSKSGFAEFIVPKQFQQNTKLISSEGAGMGK